MKKSSLILMMILAFSSLMLAADEAGGMAGAYLRLPTDARTAALGNSGGLFLNDVNMLSSNPALVSFFEQKQFSSSFHFLSLDRSLQHIAFGVKLPPSAGMSIFWTHAGVDNIIGRDNSNEITHEYHWSQDAFVISFGLRLNEWLALGLSGKILSDRLASSGSSGFSADLGLLLIPMKDLHFGFVVKELNGKVTWDISNESFVEYQSRRNDHYPTQFLLSASYLLAERYCFSAAYRFSSQIEPGWHAGVEAQLAKAFFLRAGMDNGSPAFGFGTAFTIWSDKRTRMDYAFKSGAVREGSSHLFSWLFYF